MTLLISGISLFIINHLSLGLAPGIKNGIISATSVKTWRTIFSIITFAAMLMIILGWRSTPVEYAYVAPFWTRHLTMLLMLFAFILFGAASGKTDIQRLVRHPMMTAVMVWAIAHLLANGETRSILLFGSFLIWIVLQMILVNKREGEWIKPEPAPKTRTLRNLIISLVLYVVFFSIHKYFTGISLMPTG